VRLWRRGVCTEVDVAALLFLKEARCSGARGARCRLGANDAATALLLMKRPRRVASCAISQAACPRSAPSPCLRHRHSKNAISACPRERKQHETRCRAIVSRHPPGASRPTGKACPHRARAAARTCARTRTEAPLGARRPRRARSLARQSARARALAAAKRVGRAAVAPTPRPPSSHTQPWRGPSSTTRRSARSSRRPSSTTRSPRAASECVCPFDSKRRRRRRRARSRRF